MRRYYGCAAILLVPILCLIAFHVVRNIGVEHASPAEEAAMVRKLRHAEAREVLEAFFWGVNHHSPKVLSACHPSSHQRDYSFDAIRCWKIVRLEERPSEPARDGKRVADPNMREFTVVFINSQRYLTREPSMEHGRTYEWKFTLRRDGPTSPWRIAGYGMC